MPTIPHKLRTPWPTFLLLGQKPMAMELGRGSKGTVNLRTGLQSA
jgi:hypothetical protein